MHSICYNHCVHMTCILSICIQFVTMIVYTWLVYYRYAFNLLQSWLYTYMTCILSIVHVLIVHVLVRHHYNVMTHCTCSDLHIMALQFQTPGRQHTRLRTGQCLVIDLLTPVPHRWWAVRWPDDPGTMRRSARALDDLLLHALKLWNQITRRSPASSLVLL